MTAADPTIVTNSIGLRLVEISAGDFMMGGEESVAATLASFSNSEPEWFEGELPRHKVRITKSFLIGQYEVTLKQFSEFCHAADYKVEIERDNKPIWGYDKDQRFVFSNKFRPWAPLAWNPEAQHPVTIVSWNDAISFCDWLSKKEGLLYRLPTEAEWEYACRAGSTTRFHFGDDPNLLIRYANAADSVRRAALTDNSLTWMDKNMRPFVFLPGSDGYAWTSPVGKFQPNAFGLYDMHGNVSEWCSDWYGKDYYANSPIDDPKGPSEGSYRVARGGSYFTSVATLRCASRNKGSPSASSASVGFRVVREFNEGDKSSTVRHGK